MDFNVKDRVWSNFHGKVDFGTITEIHTKSGSAIYRVDWINTPMNWHPSTEIFPVKLEYGYKVRLAKLGIAGDTGRICEIAVRSNQSLLIKVDWTEEQDQRKVSWHEESELKLNSEIMANYRALYDELHGASKL